jgi:glutamate synthase domain-containing protein 3
MKNKDENVSEEFKARVETLKKQLEPEDKENNDLYQLIEKIVNEEYEFDKNLNKAYQRAKEDNFAKGIPWIYRDDDRDIVYEFPDGRVVKKQDLDEDELLSKNYEDRIEIPDDKWVELKPRQSAIDAYNQNKKKNHE